MIYRDQNSTRAQDLLSRTKGLRDPNHRWDERLYVVTGNKKEERSYDSKTHHGDGGSHRRHGGTAS